MVRVFNISICSLLGLTFVSGVLLASVKTSAVESVRTSDVSVAVPASCELSGSGNTSHFANVNNGTYQEDIGKTTLTVFCNDGGGYAIYAAGYTGEVIGGTNSTKLVGKDLGLTIDTGTYTQGTTVDSVWSMKLTKVTNTSVSYSPSNLTIENSFDSYHTVPTNYTKVASFTSTTDLTLGSKLETTYAAYVSGTQRADTYNGKVKYTLVHPSDHGAPLTPQPSVAGKISYYPDANNVTDTMGDQTVSSSATSVVLWASNFKRPGYGFAGWSTTYDYSDPDGFLGPNETIEDSTTLATIKSDGLSLYAYWIPSAGNLQDWQGCNTMSEGDITALTDERDNDTYAVAKLADGKCWMIENLRLDYTATGNTDGSLAQGYGGVFAGLAEPETANFANNTTANSLYKSDGSGDIAEVNGATLSDIGTANSPGYRMPRYSNDNTNTNSTINPNTNVANMTGTAQNIYGYGNYYSWSAALANTNHYSSRTATDGNGKTSETANTSLCPSGWKLPSGTGSGDFGGLSNNLGGYKNASDVAQDMSSSTTPTGAEMSKVFRSFPNNFVYSGYASSGSVDYRGGNGNYWSSTAYSDTNAYYFYFNSTSVSPGTGDIGIRYLGRAIRCIVSPSV